MEPDSILGGIVAGLVIGALARLVIPGKQPIGCLLTLLFGVVGAVAGGAIAQRYTSSFWLTLLVQVAVAAVLVLLMTVPQRWRARSRRPASPPPPRHY